MTTIINISFTTHAVQRQRTRFIGDAQLEMAIQYGHAIHLHGQVAYCLLKNDLPKWLPAELAQQYNGTTVIMADGVKVVTAYKDYNGRSFAKLRKRCGRHRN